MKIFFLVVSLVTMTLFGLDVSPDHSLPDVIPEDNGKFTGAFIKVMFAVGAMVAALMFLSWSSRKMINTKIQQGNETSALKILEKRSISTKTTIYQMEFEGRSILFAESHNGVTLLHDSLKKQTFNLKDT